MQMEKPLPRDLSQFVLPKTCSTIFFHIADVFLNGILISTSNNAYHHSAFIETEMTTDLDSKTTWVESQDSQYQGDKSTVEEVNKCKEEKFKQVKCTKNKLKHVGAHHTDFFECEKFLLPGVTPHLRLHRSSNDFLLQSLGENNDKFVIVIERVSVFVTELILKDFVRLSIEEALINAPAHYLYNEMMIKSFIIQARQNSFVKENLFGTNSRETTNVMYGNQWAVQWKKGHWVFSLSTIWAACNGWKLREEKEFQFQEHCWICGMEGWEPTTTPFNHLVFVAAAEQKELHSKALRITLFWCST